MPDSSPAWRGDSGTWGCGSRQHCHHAPCAPGLSRVGCPWGWLSLRMKHSSLQRPQPPLSSHLLSVHSLSLPALGNQSGFLRFLGLVLGCVNSYSCSGMEQHLYITNRNPGSCRLVLLTGWHSYCSGVCQHVPPHVSFTGNLHHYHIYLLLLIFTVKKKQNRVSKETASQDSVHSQLGQEEPIAAGRDLSQLRIWESC